jgi:15-cis-phytoene synthase
MSAKDAPDFCADLVRSSDFARYASTLFVPVEQRRPLLALYAFNAEVSRVREQVSQPLPGEVRLQWWTDMLLGAGHGGVEGNPVASELLRVIQNFRLPVERLVRLVEEHQFDVYNDPMPTQSALEGYANDTSSTLFALAGRIAGPPSAELDHLARHAGLAYGFAQAINAMPRDAARRQLFVPLQLLEKHGSGMEQVFAGKQTPQARAAIDELVAAARQHLGAALELLAETPTEIRPIFLPLAIARADLTRLSRADNDPFQPHFRSRFSTLWLIWRASRSALYKAS